MNNVLSAGLLCRWTLKPDDDDDDDDDYTTSLNIHVTSRHSCRQLTTEINMYTGARPIYIFTSGPATKILSDEDPNDEDPALTKTLPTN